MEIMGYIGTALGAGGITQVVNWRINKKKAKVEVQADEIENIRKSVEVYQTIISDQSKRIAELTEEVQTLRREKKEMDETYTRQISVLQQQIIEISRAIGIKAQTTIRDGKNTYHERKPIKK